LGLYAVGPSPSGDYGTTFDSSRLSAAEKEIIKSGVIFCLKQKGDADGTEEVNPLQPYFLVYIRNDGTVRYNYTNAKHILEMYRSLCKGVQEPYSQLCDLFNNETNNCSEMNTYTVLLKKAVEEIVKVFKNRSNQKLISDRAALIIPKASQIHEMDNFELVTWLVIK